MENNLRKIRKEKGFRSEFVAKKLNVSRQALSQYETNKREISNEALKKLSQLYGVSIDYLLSNQSNEINSTNNLSLEQAKNIWLESLNDLDYSLVTTIFKLNELQKYKVQAYMFGMLEK